MWRINQFIQNGRAQALRCPTGIEDDRRPRIGAVAVDTLQIPTPPRPIVRTVCRVAAIRRILADAFHKYQRSIPAVRSRVAKNKVSRAFRCETPVLAGGSGDTGRREWIRVRVDCRIDAIASSPGRT